MYKYLSNPYFYKEDINYMIYMITKKNQQICIICNQAMPRSVYDICNICRGVEDPIPALELFKKCHLRKGEGYWTTRRII